MSRCALAVLFLVASTHAAPATNLRGNHNAATPAPPLDVDLVVQSVSDYIWNNPASPFSQYEPSAFVVKGSYPAALKAMEVNSSWILPYNDIDVFLPAVTQGDGPCNDLLYSVTYTNDVIPDHDVEVNFVEKCFFNETLAEHAEDADINAVSVAFEVLPQAGNGSVVLPKMGEWYLREEFQRFLQTRTLEITPYGYRYRPAHAFIRLLAKADQLNLPYKVPTHSVEQMKNKFHGKRIYRHYKKKLDALGEASQQRFYELFGVHPNKKQSVWTIALKGEPLSRSGKNRRLEEGVYDDESSEVDDTDKGSTSTGTIAVCGNGVVESTEACDGDDFNDKTCVDYGFSGGTLQCNSECGVDTSYCTTCGNGVRDFNEFCDGRDLGGLTCQTFGFAEGSLACDDTCNFDKSNCWLCGDGVVNDGEVCDGLEFAKDRATCESLGYLGGTLGCDSSCKYDTSTCETAVPSSSPSQSPSAAPSVAPSLAPSSGPTSSPMPSTEPSQAPSHSPSVSPSHAPSQAPSTSPSGTPSVAPSSGPSNVPTDSPAPSAVPSSTPSSMPTSIVKNYDFTSGGTGFSFLTNLFRSTTSAHSNQMVGTASDSKYGKTGGGLRVQLYSAGTAEELSGGWTTEITLEEALDNAAVHFHYRANLADEFVSGDYGEVLVALDDTHFAVIETIAPGYDNVWKHASAHFGHLSAGTHKLKVGSYLAISSNDPDNSSSKHFKVRFDDVQLTGSVVGTSS